MALVDLAMNVEGCALRLALALENLLGPIRALQDVETQRCLGQMSAWPEVHKF